MSLEEEALREVEVAELRAALKRERQRAARAEARVEELVGAVYEAAKDAALVVGKPAPVARPAKDRRKGEEVAVLHLTDWQRGKVTPSYSPEVCDKRVMEAVQKAIRIKEIQEADHPVRVIHVLLGGDLVEGVSIFPGQAHEVHAGLYEQMVGAAALIESVVIGLLGSFEKVVVHEVWGNHGRLGRRGDVDRHSNADRLVGCIARDRLSNQERLEWPEPPPSWYQIVEVGDYRLMLCHGDQIKSFGGNIPAYGILRKANAWAAGAIPHRFDALAMGHFHTPMQLTMANGGTVYVTGSPESDNEYAREFVAAQGRPSQRLMFVDPRKGRETSMFTLWLT